MLGGAIGLERELRDHEAGLRTHILVALGAALFTLVAAIGMAAGAGFYGPAVGTTVIALVSLYPLRVWSRQLMRRGRPAHGTLHVEVETGGHALVLEQAERLFGSPVHVEVTDEMVTFDLALRRDVTRLIAALSGLDGVRRVEWAPRRTGNAENHLRASLIAAL